MKNTDQPVVVEQIFDLPASQLWPIITDPDHMREWFFGNIPEFRAEEGFKTQFEVQAETDAFMHLWEITKVDHGRMIRYNWRYAGFPGDSFVTMELIPQNGQTLLRLTHEITESFPEHIPEFSREACLAGWNYFIVEQLKKYAS